MAEHQLVLNDQNFLNMGGTATPESNNVGQPDGVLNTTTPNNLPHEIVALDDIGDTLQVTKTEQTDANTNNESMEEGHVESPTTGESFIYKCVFCERNLTAGDDPKLLECLHNTCGSCVNNKLFEQNDNSGKGTVQCASCHLNCDAEKIIENQFLLEVANTEDTHSVKTPAELKCSSCSDDAVATSWCVDCTEYICNSCVQAHQRLKITKDHTIKPKEEVENPSASSLISATNLFCAVHPHEKLSLFCENCDKLTCRDCQLTEHRDHKYKFTHEIASDARKNIGTMLKDVTYKRVLLNSAMKVIADRQSLITDKKQALVNEITQLVVKLTNTINVRGKQLIARLTEVCDSKQKTLQEKKEALEQLSKMTDHCIEFSQHALESGSDMALLFSKRQMTSHLHRIKCKRADIPNPEIPVRINLALDKLPELVKVISTIGQIVVDGRVYPSQATSPSAMLPPHGSPSPGHSRPPQQQSPINPLQQAQVVSFHPPPRMLPAYGQQFQQNVGMGPQNMHHNQAQKLPPNSMAPGMSQVQPTIALAQQLAQNMQRMQGQRPQMSPQMQRALLPNLTSRLNNHQQQQVSSSTHPQGMLHDRGNLRGLLQPTNNTVYVQTAPRQYQAVQPAFAQQFQNRFPNQQIQFRQQISPATVRMLPPNQQNSMPFNRANVPNQGFQSPPAQQPQGAKWHIPQQGNDASQALTQFSNNRNSALPSINDNFKITLKSQNHNDPKNLPATVTSTIPKTPSPNHIQGKSDSEHNLDKYCEASVKDLMATIAKLDSNGVQVLAEGRAKQGGSPHVDSSTDDSVAGPSKMSKSDNVETGKDDPNEDWCAVCMDGGELVCCDKCPKVFHQFCHIPNLSVEESDTWQCLLCMNFADIPDNAFDAKKDGELSPKEQKIAERIVLELYCQYELSLPFREVLGPEHTDYHSVIKKPMALDTIRQKLDWSAPEHYTNMEDLVRDVRLMFRNAYTYNAMDSQVYNDGKALEKFFDQQLDKWLPEYTYMFDDCEIQPPSKKYKRIICD